MKTSWLILFAGIITTVPKLAVSQEQGTQRFDERLVGDGFTYSFGIGTADLDGDGDLDITAADALPNNHLYWFENNGQAEFKKHFIQKNDPERLERHAIGDIDNDGHPDIVIVKNLVGDLLWFQNSGDPSEEKLWNRHVITRQKIPGAYDVALGDFDGDGDLDVAASTWRLSNNFVWFENDGTPTDGEWKMHLIDQLETETRMIRAADIDSDGDLDLVGTARLAPLITWYENTQSKEQPNSSPIVWTKHVIDDQSRQPIHGEIVDIDQDGDLDIVMSFGMSLSETPKSEQVAWYENNGEPTQGNWQKHLIASSYPGAFESCAGDIDGDGDLDVVTSAWGKQGGLAWFENRGNPRGNWQQHSFKSDWPRANAVKIADLDSDGRLDILAGAERGANEVRWWRNIGPRRGLEIGFRRQLFLDDFIIEKMNGLRRSMHQPVKRGSVIKPDQPGENWLQTRCKPAWDNEAQCFKIWLFASAHAPMGKWGPRPTGACYAESQDGLQWTKPALRQVEIAGSLENNFISAVPEIQWPQNIIENVVYDPKDPDPQHRFKGFLGALGRRPIASPDGKNWSLLDARELKSRDESNLSYDPEEGLFIATFKQLGPNGRAHRIWTSRDFRRWTDTGTLFHADEEDQRRARQNIRARLADPSLYQPIKSNPDDYHADIYNLGVFNYEGIYIGMPAVFHHTSKHEGNSEGFHLIQLACSRDLRHWKRLGNRKPFIGPSPVNGENYDLAQLLSPSAPLVRGDELWFYYSGLRYRATPDPPNPYMGAICLGVLRRDGFISVNANHQEGLLTTQPFYLRGKTLHVNINVKSSGSCFIEALDQSGNIIAVSNAIHGDQPRCEVGWLQGDFAAMKGQAVQLRFRLKNSSLYSFWINE
ncbi:MAG: VCBS repeat-containing protein [Planctomycetota bacterium]|nr:VCBS repeat-containing protein [Planctomycetota bacterium]